MMAAVGSTKTSGYSAGVCGVISWKQAIFINLRVLESQVLRGIGGPKREKVTRVWIKLHNEESRCYKDYNKEETRWAERVTDMRKKRNVY
jgi:hypothetical protein